jgi:putative ATP-binding cassette transporter
MKPVPSSGDLPIRPGLRSAWRLAQPFWQDRRERGAWALLAAVVFLTLGSVWLNVRFSDWNNRFYDALQNHDLHAFWHLLGVFALLAAAFIAAAVYRLYLQQRLLMRWRTHLTDRLLRRWLAPGTAYRLAQQPQLDNPDQRIAEDASRFVGSTLDLSLGLLNACVTLVSFVGILWRLSGTLPLSVAGRAVTVPGYMVWVALAYAGLGSWITHRLGRRLVPLNVQQQRVEADFRYALVQVRDHAEAIALAGGEARERGRLAQVFEGVRANWDALIRTTKRLTWFSAGYGQLANVFPLLAAAPRYFAGRLQLGGLMQTAQAFGQVQGALSWFIDAYTSLADWRATVERLSRFSAQADEAARLCAPAIVRVEAARFSIELRGLRIETPQGRELLHVPARRLEPGQALLITGPSGSGKTSLLRTIAGLWRRGEGCIALPRGDSLMFVPQRPYLPQGTLAEVLAWPQTPKAFSETAMQDALARVGLAPLTGRLHESRAWAGRLSPGEQQRLQFARVLLQRPDWVFLDEATSALDEASEAKLYRLLRTELPSATVVSIGHRSTLRALHDVEWAPFAAQPESRLRSPVLQP